jgi:hypothetical protein
MADETRPEHMSEQDWTNFQSRYRPQPGTNTTPGTIGAGSGGPAPSTPGVPGAVAPGLKNPAPSPAPALQPSPAPQVGLGNTMDAPASGGPRRVTGPGLLSEEAAAGGQQPSAQPQQSPAQQMQAQLRTSIMGMLGTDVNQASVTDADIAPQSQAFASAAQRQQAARRAELAHNAARGGYADSGGFEQRLDSLSQQTGQAIGAHDAELVGQKLETRRQQLNTALQAAQQLGMADEANNLQRQIANLGAQVDTRGQDISREGLQLQNNLANLDASTRIYLGDLNAQMQQQGYSTQERLARMDTELRRYGIDVQGRLGALDTALRSQLGNRQIDLGYDQLGVQVGTTQAQLNRDAVMAGLGG